MVKDLDVHLLAEWGFLQHFYWDFGITETIEWGGQCLGFTKSWRLGEEDGRTRVDLEDTKYLCCSPQSFCLTAELIKAAGSWEKTDQEKPGVAGSILTPQQRSKPRPCSELCRNLRSVGIFSVEFRCKPFQKWLRAGLGAFGNSVWMFGASPGSVSVGRGRVSLCLHPAHGRIASQCLCWQTFGSMTSHPMWF